MEDYIRLLCLWIVRTPVAHALPRAKHILKFHVVPEIADDALRFLFPSVLGEIGIHPTIPFIIKFSGILNQ